jgi:hypothetical protein
VEGKFCGEGTLCYANGYNYTGQFEKNIPHGRGVMTYENGGVYSRYWENGKRKGQGRREYSNGTVYEGEWNDYWGGDFEGQVRFVDGRVFNGICQRIDKLVRGHLKNKKLWCDEIIYGSGQMKSSETDVEYVECKWDKGHNAEWEEHLLRNKQADC